LSDSIYAYQGSASGSLKFPFGRVLAAQIKEDFLFDISTMSWITDVKILGGNLGFAATIPFPIGTERTSAGLTFTGPLNTFSGSLTQSTFGIGDMAGWLGWSAGTRETVTGT